MGNDTLSSLENLRTKASKVAGDNISRLFNILYTLRGKDCILVPVIGALGLAIMFMDVEAGATISLRPLFFVPVMLSSLIQRRVVAVILCVAVAFLAVESFKISGGFGDEFQFAVNFIPTALIYLLISEFISYILFAVQKLHTNIVFLQDMIRDVKSPRA